MTAPTPPPLRYLLMATHVPGSGSLGGVVRYTVGLAEALARRPDVELHVLVAGDGANAFTRFVPADRVHSLPGLPTPALSILERLGALPGLRRGRFDVIHGTKHILPRFAAGTRRVLTVHDMLLFDRGRDYPLLKRLLLGGPYRASLRDADVVVAVSHATVDRLVDHLPEVRDRVRVAQLAPSPALTTATPEPVEALSGARFALVVGDASVRKNLGLVVGTWARVRERVPGAVLAVVGPTPWGTEDRGGSAWDALIADGAAVGLRGIPDGALRWCYENASVVLCPSLLEGFGLPTVEAAAFGTPVITSEDPALCEAAAGWGRAAASWSPDDWVDAVATAMTTPGRRPPGTNLRTWDDVAADTLEAARGGAAPAPAPDPDGPGPEFAGRTGVSPYRAPMRVRHVVASGDEDAGATATRLAADHRDHGWDVEIDTLARGGGGPAADGADLLVLHGLCAGRVRSRVRGSVPTVLLTGSDAPRTPLGWAREASLARWTNALVLPADAAPSWSRVSAPVTRLPASGLASDEAAAVFVRARAWGN